MPHQSASPDRRLVAWLPLLLIMAGCLQTGCARSAESDEPERDSVAAEPAEDSTIEAEEDQVAQADESAPRNPFAHRVKAPEFPPNLNWINTSGPLRMQDLKGKFVLLDFWTYCCINCMHILPELKKLEQKYPNQLVVIGVHSAKFETEQETQNIAEAVLRYEIEHPVVNDAGHQIWNMYGVRSWPTILLIDPEGNAVWGRAGEFEFPEVDAILQAALPYYRQKGSLDETPVHFDLLAARREATPLEFPGKVLADEQGQRLFITDSNHNRIVITTLDGQLIDIIGSGTVGRQDGSYAEAQFHHPQGLALDGETLYVADTENHLLRRVDLKAREVTTLAGTGEQSRNPWPGSNLGGNLPERFVGPPSTTALNSPWALLVHGQDLFIAMAGPHQIWKMRLDGSEIGPYAGNGREDIVDGPLLPNQPYELGYSSFAQPSGLTTDGEWIYVADCEGSSIRAVPLDPTREVRTVVGTSELPHARLFTFGDQDGEGLVRFARAEGERLLNRTVRYEGVLLQHPLGVAYHEGKLFVADTYNNKIKEVDLKTTRTRTIAGTGETELLDEPGGLSYAAGKLYIADTNNHRIQVLDLSNNELSTLAIPGLEPPARPKPSPAAAFAGAIQQPLDPVRVRPEGGQITLKVDLKLPTGWKINPAGPMRYRLEPGQHLQLANAVSDPPAGLQPVQPPAAEFTIKLQAPSTGRDQVKLSLNYYYCQEGGEGICKVGSVTWTIPVILAADAEASEVRLEHEVRE